MTFKIYGYGLGSINPSDKKSTINLPDVGTLIAAYDKAINGKTSKATEKPAEKKPSNPYAIRSILANHEKKAFTVAWADGTYTVIHLQPGDKWDDEKALAMCFVKKMMGNKGSFNDIFTQELPSKLKVIFKKEEPKKDTPKGETMATGGDTDGFSTEKNPIEKAKEAIKKAGASAEKVDKAVDTLSELIDNFLRGSAEQASTKKYKVFSKSGYTMTPAGEYETAKLAKDRITELAKELWGSKPYYYRVWTEDDKLVIDFGSYIKFIVVEGMTMDDWTKN